MTPFDERELTDEELAQVTGAGSSTQAPLNLTFQDVDHVSFSSADNGDLQEQVFFTGTATPPPTGP
jgi:hypothetical protein